VFRFHFVSLYSTSYHHFGDTKTWYGIAASDAEKFEQAMIRKFKSERGPNDTLDDETIKLLWSKTLMVKPEFFVQQGVKLVRAKQTPGSFIVTFPKAYHSGFSAGYNLTEAVNFALDDWYRYGFEAAQRYSKLKRTPILDHDRILFQAVKTQYQNNGQNYTALSSEIRTDFERMVNDDRNAHNSLPTGVQTELIITQKDDDTKLCGYCQRACFVSYYTCSCSGTPTYSCPEHWEIICKCKESKKYLVRDDVRLLIDEIKL